MTVVNPKSISGINSITTGSGSDNLLTIHTSDASSTERVRVNSDGDVIVGSGITVSPDGDIFATGVTTATTFVGALTGNVTGNVTGNISGGTVAGSTGTFTSHVSLGDNDQLRLGDATGGDLKIYHDGNNSAINDVGTGSLYIQGSDNIYIRDYDTSENHIVMTKNGAVDLYHNGSKTFETTSDGSKVTGELDVHKSGTGDVFHVQGNGTGAVVAKIENAYNSDNDRFAILELKSGKGSIRFNSNGDSNEGAITYNMADNTMVFGVNNASEKLRIQSGGGISFNGDTATANALADYEEGTFTPDWRGASALGTTTYGSYNTASYIKVGNQVTVRGYSELNGTSGGSGMWFIHNLPFVVKNGHAYRSVGAVLIENFNLDSDILDIVCYANPNNNHMHLRGSRDNANYSSNIRAQTDDNFEVAWTLTYQVSYTIRYVYKLKRLNLF